MFRRILVANRGEIALRVIRACREMGIECVAVYSTADSDSIHRRMADRSICIGPPQPARSYLNIDNIISAALVSKCDAIHPGYGFLAENADFAKACIDNDIAFIGPPPDVISLAGNKSSTLKIMRSSRIPVIPGSDGNITGTAAAAKICKKIGYPVIIKASFGGGGKGMRICKNRREVEDFYPMARRESEKAFGTGELYIEKYIQKPRHIEVQIIADNSGKTVCAGERECSIQRRHQKLIEEAPPVNLPPKISRIISEYAVRAARAIGYRNIGTIEFLLDENNDLYFIEVNTRIQVEHPVTEAVTGIDLVREQILTASGKMIDSRKENYIPGGHAIEFRINAEDPGNDFAPNSGRITKIFIPGGPGIRVDTSIGSDSYISPFYDSLIAKLIVWDIDRESAIKRSAGALDEFIIEGINTTIAFHKNIIKNNKFIEGAVHTHFIEEELSL